MRNETKIILPTPAWITTAIVGFDGPCTDPTPAFVQAAADRVWATMVALAELRQQDESEPLTLRLDVTAYG